MSTTKTTLVDDGSRVYTEIMTTDPLTATLWAALRRAEAHHIDNTGMSCNVRMNRDHCCVYCSTAEAIRAVLRDELDIDAHWDKGRTVIRAAGKR